jgi:hypothetical protein
MSGSPPRLHTPHPDNPWVPRPVDDPPVADDGRSRRHREVADAHVRFGLGVLVGVAVGLGSVGAGVLAAGTDASFALRLPVGLVIYAAARVRRGEGVLPEPPRAWDDGLGFLFGLGYGVIAGPFVLLGALA